MDGRTPASRQRPPNASDVYWAESTGRRNTTGRNVAMAGRRRSDRALRDKLRSPGRPGMARREDRLRFWALIAAGLSSEDAAIGAGGVAAGRDPLVSGGWWHALFDICAIVEAAVWALSGICRAGGDRARACTGLWSARDRPPTWSSCIDRLARIEAQRGDAKRRSRVSG